MYGLKGLEQFINEGVNDPGKHNYKPFMDQLQKQLR